MQLNKVTILVKRILSRYCRYFRKKQVVACLSADKTAGFNLNKNERDRFYQEISTKYKEIRIHRLWSTRIGEYIPRYLNAVEDAERNAKEGILDVFVLSDCVNHNSRLSRVMGRKIHIVDNTNAYMWRDILCHFPNVEFAKYWDDYSIRKNDVLRNADKVAQYFKLTAEEEREGYNKMLAMNVREPFVCVGSRDSKYLAIVLPDKDCSYHDYRDSNINNFRLAANFLKEKGIISVRMGRYVQDAIGFDNCIDYANQYYDELLDIVLLKKCKFYVGDTQGLCYLPIVLNCPVAFKNYVPVFINPDAFPYNPHNLYIFKKYYKRDENRFLSIKEMMQIDKKTQFDGKKYIELGIEVIENSEEEILDLVIEMNARLDGVWIDKPEDIELQKKYRSLYQAWCRQEHYNEAAIWRFNVGTMFLKKNPFLLE